MPGAQASAEKLTRLTYYRFHRSKVAVPLNEIGYSGVFEILITLESNHRIHP